VLIFSILKWLGKNQRFEMGSRTNFEVCSKTAKKHYFAIFGLENSFFQKIIGFMYFRPRFRSEKKFEKFSGQIKN
jgi:hypothetical protein